MYYVTGTIKEYTYDWAILNHFWTQTTWDKLWLFRVQGQFVYTL